MINMNAAFEDELYFEYLKNPESVSKEWREYFEKVHGKSVYAIENVYSDSHSNAKYKDEENGSYSPRRISGRGSKYKLKENDNPEELNSYQAEMAIGMEESLDIPTATSTRTIPVKALDENRRIINRYMMKLKKPRISFTHILAWAVVRALMKYPHLNDSFDIIDGKPVRIQKKSLNIGLAVDITSKDGRRLLLVPSIKNAQDMDFGQFAREFRRLINRTRNSELTLEELSGTTLTLTNPGMIGTSASIPRLQKGQGAIIATGNIDYPTEFQAVRPEILSHMAVSKVVTLTNTYDHRIIQGAESAEFLAYLNKLLTGGSQFYDQIFYSLNIPFEPVRWEKDAGGGTYYGNKSKDDEIEKGAHVMQMINAYRVRGHLLSSTNPLGFDRYYYPELDPAYYGFTIWDLERIFHADDAWAKNNLPLRDIIEILRETYCGSTGIEFMHIQDPEKKEWIKRHLEKNRNTIDYSSEEKIRTFKKLVEAEEFENYLHTKFIGHKRFSLEGGESVIVMIDKILEYSADNEIDTVIFGMAHRGRLNVLVNNVGKSISKIFKEFDEEYDPTLYQGSGDVKYHLGDKGFYISPRNNSVNILLSPNPSHLELVDPVVEGMARALENEINDTSYSRVFPVLIHGDAAFAGQGIVAETLNLSQLDGYKVGGTIHIVINNQIGFTTNTDSARSTVYATDIAKMIQTPILHVNGNDPEAVKTAANFACMYRAKFKSDVIIDMLCYRKYGHNEADEPTYTQPLLYKKIKSMTPIAKLYEKQLIHEQVLSKDEAGKIRSDFKSKLDNAFAKKKDSHDKTHVTVQKNKDQVFEPVKTSVRKDIIEEITHALSSIPDNFNPNPKVKSLMKKRREMVESDKPAIDWAMGELLALGTLLIEGKEVRFSGQDSRRGTFSQRHSVLTDITNENDYINLNNIRSGQAVLRIFDSPLSEMAVLGFEYGYSVISANGLTLWEAQFGDFYNNAQTVIDQYIACGEVKWGQTSNLVLLLPHSYDGQGPEHSSARLERFLQLCAQENMIIGNFTTPAQYFHALRRQTILPFKLPMVLMTPKSMLRHPKAVSGVKEFTENRFMEILDDPEFENGNGVKKILACTGKIYYEIIQHREKLNIDNIPVVRVEQLYPFNSILMKEILDKYPDAENLTWVQEEPKNMGAWNFVKDYFYEILPDGMKLGYSGRNASASTATGLYKVHLMEQKMILDDALLK
jgi:2-oxoglutarate decarboxylase